MSEIALVSVPRKRPGWLLAVLIVATILGVVLILASFLPLMFSPMLFDAGESPQAWTMFIAVWTFPPLLLLGLIIAWAGFAARTYWLIWAGAVLAVLPVLVIAGCFILA